MAISNTAPMAIVIFFLFEGGVSGAVRLVVGVTGADSTIGGVGVASGEGVASVKGVAESIVKEPVSGVGEGVGATG